MKMLEWQNESPDRQNFTRTIGKIQWCLQSNGKMESKEILRGNESGSKSHLLENLVRHANFTGVLCQKQPAPTQASFPNRSTDNMEPDLGRGIFLCVL